MGENTSSAYVVTDRADNQIAAFHPGAGGIAYGGPVDLTGAAVAIVAPGCLEDMILLPDFYKQHNLKYFYDPSQQLRSLSDDQLRSTLDGAEVLFGNDYEYKQIQDRTGWHEGQMLEHVKTLVITSSEAGTMVATKEGSQMVPAVKIERVVDPTGAGDAHRAGFIKAYLAGLPLETCAKLANTVASFCVESYGTQTHTFTLHDVHQRYKETYNEDLPLLA
jgi:adenosine kinase